MAIFAGNSFSEGYNYSYSPLAVYIDKNNPFNAAGNLNTINVALIDTTTFQFGVYYENAGMWYLRGSYYFENVEPVNNIATISNLNLQVQQGDFLAIVLVSGGGIYVKNNATGKNVYSKYTAGNLYSTFNPLTFTTSSNTILALNAEGIEAGKKVNSVMYGKWNGTTLSKLNGI